LAYQQGGGKLTAYGDEGGGTMLKKRRENAVERLLFHTPDVLKVIHTKLFEEFQITTSDSGRFLRMDTEYNLTTGVFKMHIYYGYIHRACGTTFRGF
jgi:hypothetical protein